MLVLNNQQVESVLDMGACVEALDEAYRALAAGDAIDRPRSHTFIPTSPPGAFYLLKSMEGGLARGGVMALRLNSERWRLSSEVPQRIEKLATTDDGRFTEFILLFSTENGGLLAILPDGHIQRSRVAGTTAVAAKYLAPPNARTLGLFGSGWQAEAHIMTYCQVRPIERVKVYSPTPEHRRAFAQRLSLSLGLPVEAVDEPEAVVDGSDIVACASNSQRPVVKPEWLKKGMHLSTVRGTEIDSSIFRRCDLVVIHNAVQALDFFCGESLPEEMAEEKQIGSLALELRRCPQLSEVVSGAHRGRTEAEEITLFVNGVGPGLGTQFAAVGKLVYEEARRRGLGQEIPADWFLDVERHP